MLFTSEVRSSDSSFVQAIWRTQSEGTGSFISPAAIHWDMLLMTYRGKTTFTVQGPETKATRASLPALSFFGATDVILSTTNEEAQSDDSCIPGRSQIP